MQIRGDLLFSDTNYLRFTAQRLQAALQEIETFTENYVLNTSAEDLTAYLQQEYSLDVPNLHVDNIHILDQGEDKIPVGGQISYGWGGSEQMYAAGRIISYVVPFVGDRKLFRIQPPEFSFNPPKGFVEDGLVKLEFFIQTQDNPESIQASFQSNLDYLRQCLNSMSLGASVFNEKLDSEIRQKLQSRKQKILKERNLVAALGFPIKQRSDIPLTFAAPVQRHRLQTTPSPASSQSFHPEPALLMEDYEHILKVICSMAQIIEYNPRAYSSMPEEVLRTQILVQLNGHYTGQVTGETFNYEGKTDILIRVEQKNIFVAECKIWGGSSILSDAIDQILSYLSWRDTKAAIILFSHNKDFSSVVNQVPGIVKSHPNCKRQVANRDETNYRFILGQKEDVSREITLTVLCFHVPTS